MSGSLLVYGATGYVGDHVVRTAARSGLRVVAAGRDAAKLAPLARDLGIESRSFGPNDRLAVDRALEGIAAVLNCAGPFKYTAVALAQACVRRGTHYLDITGEIPVFEALQAMHGEAEARGVMVLPGVGFDVVPTDCLALHLEQRLPTADRLTLAFQTRGPAGLPPGTQRTAIELMHYGMRVRRNGRVIEPDEPGKTITVDFGRGPVRAQLIPWGDVFTAFFSTGIPNIETFVAAPPSLRRQLAFGRAIAPLAKFALVRRLLRTTVRKGPSAELRASTETHVWGQVVDADGRRATARLHGPEAGLVWTTSAALGAARKVLAGRAPPGYQTPALAFGSDFVLEAEGVSREDVP